MPPLDSLAEWLPCTLVSLLTHPLDLFLPTCPWGCAVCRWVPNTSRGSCQRGSAEGTRARASLRHGVGGPSSGSETLLLPSSRPPVLLSCCWQSCFLQLPSQMAFTLTPSHSHAQAEDPPRHLPLWEPVTGWPSRGPSRGCQGCRISPLGQPGLSRPAGSRARWDDGDDGVYRVSGQRRAGPWPGVAAEPFLPSSPR